MAAPTFTAPKRNNLTTSGARTQAGGEINPLYDLAVRNVNSQMKQNQSSAIEQAAARGLGRSGLAQDSLNKLALGAQSDIAGIEAERASKVASLARQLLERDQDVGFRENQQAFNVWTGEQNFRIQGEQFAYQKERDKVADSQWQQEFDYRKAQDAAAAAARAAGGGGGGGGGGRGSSGRRSSGRSSSGGSSYSSKPWGTDTTSAMTLDQIKWYDNTSNFPKPYGYKEPMPANKMAPMAQAYTAAAPVKKPLYTPSYSAALPNRPTAIKTPTKKGSMSKQPTPWYKKVLGIFG